MELNRLEGSFLLLLTKEILNSVISSLEIAELSSEDSCETEVAPNYEFIVAENEHQIVVFCDFSFVISLNIIDSLFGNRHHIAFTFGSFLL
jgi:hypothetical protein